MITDQELLERVQAEKDAFGIKCGKFAGTVTVQLLRHALLDLGLPVSERDVFIRGVPVEIDLLLAKPVALIRDRLSFEPSDVIAALEIKNSGSFGDGTIKRTGQVFSLIRAADPRIHCIYVTLAERRGYKWAVRSEDLGHRAYTLFWHNGSERNRTYNPTGHWKELVEELSSLAAARK